MSKFDFLQLTDEIRQLMLTEVTHDVKENGDVYHSKRFNENGLSMYLDELKTAIQSGDEETLQAVLESGDNFNKTELKNGKEVKVPSNAAKLLAQCEFNRYYIRAVSQKALNVGVEEVEIYRARESSWSRPESEAKIGSLIDARLLLDDLRETIGNEPRLLPEINSGLSVKFKLSSD